MGPDEGWVYIVGYGSLLSEVSARGTFPSLSEFQQAEVVGWRRVFCHASPLFLTRGVARVATKEMAALSVERWDETIPLFVSLFRVPEREMPAFYVREEEFEFSWVEVRRGRGGSVSALMCVKSSDKAFRARLGSEEMWHEKVTKYGLDSIWTDDVLPCRVYLRHCVLAAGRMGPGVLANFLDTTFLSDRCTTVRQYLVANPDIMEEEAPELWKDRYSG